MTTFRLALIAGALLVAVGLAATNPTIDEYLSFIQGELRTALDRMDRSAPDRERHLIRSLFQVQGKRIIDGVVRPATVRSNWGLWSMYRTKVLDQEVVVLAVAGWFIPLHGIDEAILKIGRLAF